MTHDVLLDAGPLAAVLDPRDQWHEQSMAAWPRLMGRCVTTEAVIAEAAHLQVRGSGRAWAPLDFLLGAGIPIIAIQPVAHRRAVRLMQQYQDLPMDYADATLVVLAEALGISEVFTTDRLGFTAYRGPRGGPFRLLPDK